MSGDARDAREVAIDPVAAPEPIAAALRGYRWSRDLVGEAGATVWRLDADGRPALYLKHGAGTTADDVADEAARLRWLGPRLTVPAVRQVLLVEDEAWLLTTALPGRTAWQCLDAEPERRPALVAALAAFLRRLHAIPAETCPFNAAHPLRLALARERMEAGLVDKSDFGEAHAGWSAERVWRELTGLLPLAPDPVMTHGDCSLDNILVEHGRVTGCIDVGRAGVADRYQDLAILADCLDEFGGGLRDILFESYGLVTPDERKIAFHICLDEFF